MAPTRNFFRLATLPPLFLAVTSAVTFDARRKVIEGSFGNSSTAASPLENGAALSDSLGGTYQFQMRLLNNGVGVWKDGGDRGAQAVPDELKGATLFAGTMDQVWTGSLYVKAKFAGYVYVFGEPQKNGGITKLFWKQVGSFRWQGARDNGMLVIYKTAMRKDSIMEIPITSKWNGGVAFKKDESAQAVANKQRTDGAFGKGKQQAAPIVHRGGFRKDREQLSSNNAAMSYSYFGCMSNSKLVVSHKKDDPLAMSVERCFVFCSTWGSSVFFGLENGRKCWCAAVFYGDKLEQGQCDQPCFGSPKQKCGGAGGVASVHMMFNCNNAPATTTAKKKEPVCDEASWPDKDHGLVCGECKVLVNRFNTAYGSCNAYCAKVGRQCVGAWEEVNDDCEVKYNMTCDQSIKSSDAICQCGEAQAKTRVSKDQVATTTQEPQVQVFYTEAEGQTCGGQAWQKQLLQRGVAGRHGKAPIVPHARRLAKLLQSSGPTRAPKKWEAGGHRIQISGSETMVAEPKACKKACSMGDSRYKCGGFTYDSATSKCTFLLSASEGKFKSGQQFTCFTKNFPDEDDKDKGKGQTLQRR